MMAKRENTFWLDTEGNIRLESALSPKDLGIQQADTFAALIVDGDLVLVKLELELKDKN